MKNLLLLLIIVSVSCKSTTDKKTEILSYKNLHSKAIVVDSHNDVLTYTMENNLIIDTDLKGQTHTDLTRLRQGGVDVQFFSVWCDGNQIDPFNYAIRQIDSLDAVVKRNPDKIVKIAHINGLSKVINQNKMAAIVGVEGGHMMENDLNKLDSLYKRGTRYMTLTWNNSTPWATSALDETTKNNLKHKGLTDFGKQVVRRMNELGMMVDISHVGAQTFWDVIHTTSKPVIASHSSVYNLCPHYRNLKDEQIKAIAKNGGVIQVNFSSGFLDSTYQKNKDAFILRHKSENDSLVKNGLGEWDRTTYLFAKYKKEANSIRPPLSLLIQHIEYIVKMVGIDYVGLGSDFDGVTSLPKQLDDVTSYPLITKALVEKGYSTEDVSKILGGNLLRVLKANEVNN